MNIFQIDCNRNGTFELTEVPAFVRVTSFDMDAWALSMTGSSPSKSVQRDLFTAMEVAWVGFRFCCHLFATSLFDHIMIAW